MIKTLDSSLRWNDDEEEKSLVAVPIARLSFLAIALPVIAGFWLSPGGSEYP